MDPIQSLTLVHGAIRRGEFGPDVHKLVDEHAESWRALQDEALCLKGAYVSAEVSDYFGEYDVAKAQLAPFADEVVDRLSNPSADTDPTVQKRRIWLALAHAVTLYRSEDYPGTEEVLKLCTDAVKRLDPDEKSHFGTRARLAYSMGQVARQLRDHKNAREAFDESVYFANRRFIVKTDYAELPQRHLRDASETDRQSFEQDRLLAQWTIGKSLSLGLGWIAFTIGSLSSANMQMSAGCSLLRGTEDSVHRAYATLLLGAVARAKAGNDPDLLKRSLHFLEDGAKGLADHPTYKFRASYELALAYYKQESTRDKARAELRRLKSGLRTGLRSARWHSASLVLESRLERLSGSYAGARKLAEQAVDVIKITDYSESHAEALIALGEAHRARAIARLEQARSSADLSFEDAIKFFVMARERAGNNPKILAVSNLQIASVYIHQHLLAEAHAAFAPWLSTFKNVVEHGFVHALAKDVGERLQIKERFFRHDNDLSLDTPKQRHIEELEAFLLRRAAKLGWSPEQTAVNFGIGVSALNKLKRQLNERGMDVPLSRRGRPRRK